MPIPARWPQVQQQRERAETPTLVPTTALSMQASEGEKAGRDARRLRVRGSPQRVKGNLGLRAVLATPSDTLRRNRRSHTLLPAIDRRELQQLQLLASLHSSLLGLLAGRPPLAEPHPPGRQLYLLRGVGLPVPVSYPDLHGH